MGRSGSSRHVAAGAVVVVTGLAVLGARALVGVTRSALADAAAPAATLDDLVGAAAAVGVWCCLAWVATAVLVSIGATLPGVVGQASSVLAARVAPLTVRRLVAASLGTAVAVTAPSGAFAATAAETGAAAYRTASVVTLPGSSTAAHAHLAAPASARGLAAHLAATPPAPPVLPSLDHPVGAPGPEPVDEPARVVVAAGDSLWRIARLHLGPGASDAEVADAWPRWYEANRAVIGDDPDLLHPGQVLTVPETFDVERGAQP